MKRLSRTMTRTAIALSIALGLTAGALGTTIAQDDGGFCCSVFNQEGGGGHPPVLFGVGKGGVGAGDAVHTEQYIYCGCTN